MKERFFIKGSLADRITYYHLVVFAMALPFDRLYSELALISLLMHTLIHIERSSIKKIKISIVLLPAAIYALTVLATTYTKFYDEAFFEWERQLALLLFPLIIVYNSFDFKRYVFNILMALGASCFLTILYLYYDAFSIIAYNHLPVSAIFSNAFINHNFSAAIDMHATYFSMYIALAAVALIIAFMQTANNRIRMLYGLMIFVLLAGLFQLSSRAVLIAFGVIINVIPLFLFQKKKRIWFMTASVLLTLSVILVLTSIDNLKTRFIVDLKEDLTQAGVTNNTLEPRVTRWECGWQLVKQSPIFGHGSGSEIASLKEIYFQRKLYNSYLHELNVHNQYLSMLIKTGIIGLIVLLFILFTGCRMAIAERDVPFLAFLVIISVVFFSENVLDANKGIFFFAFFYSLFYTGANKNEREFIRK
jgi:O-antigen ligase